MIPSLPLFHAVAGKPVIVLGEGEAAEAKRRLVERAGGVIVGESSNEARLAFVALDLPEPAVERLRARGVLVNVPDRPDLCDFTVPSILDRAPVVVTIGTGGASAGLAKALRLRLEGILPQGLGRIAAWLAEARGQVRERWPDPADRRRALDAAMQPGGPLDPLAEPDEPAMVDWLSQGNPASGSARHELRLVSDDPADLTLRQARLLGSADVVAHEPGVPPAILDRSRADARRVAIGAGEAVPEDAGLVVVLRR